MRWATANFFSAVRAMPSSSMVRATTAAPNFLTNGSTCEVRFSPSSRLMELTIAFPGISLRAVSMTSASVESIITGTGTRVASIRMVSCM